MGNLILNFLQEQGILIVMGLLVLEGIAYQWVASRRYRRLRAGIQSLTGQPEIHHQVGTATYNKNTDLVAESVAEIKSDSCKRGRRTSRRQEVGRSVPERVESQQELDAQLLYLKQSLDRIAAGRDQKLEEEPREHRKLTPEQEAIIADVLREYLS